MTTSSPLGCPHCGATAMTQGEKSFLGPARAVPCKACGRNVGVSWSAMIALLPFLLAMPACVLLVGKGYWLPGLACLLAGVAAMFYLHRMAPLRTR